MKNRINLLLLYNGSDDVSAYIYYGAVYSAHNAAVTTSIRRPFDCLSKLITGLSDVIRHWLLIR